MNILKSLCKAGVGVNEDIISVKGNIAIVLDGATSLGNDVMTGYSTDAEWYVNEFIKLFHNNYNNDVIKTLDTIIPLLKEQYENNLNGNNLQGYSYPSATGAIIEEKNDKVNIYHVGDVVVRIEEEKRGQIMISDDILPELDASIFTKATVLSRLNETTFKEEIKNLDWDIKKNRMLMNSEEGYKAFSLEKIDIGVVSYPIESIGRIMITTDGFHSIIGSIPEYMDDKIPANDLGKRIENAMKSDPDYKLYPRFKDIDDYTMLLIDFK